MVTLFVMLIGVLFVIALAIHLGTAEEPNKLFICAGFVIFVGICVYTFSLAKQNTNTNTNFLEVKTSEVTVVVVDKKTSTSSYYIPVNNVPLFFHNTYYKIVIEDEGTKDTISVSEKVYDQLSVGDTAEVYKKVTYLFGAYFGTDYKLKN